MSSLAAHHPSRGVAPGAPALRKTLDEPPAATVFVLLSDDVSLGLATVASR